VVTSPYSDYSIEAPS